MTPRFHTWLKWLAWLMPDHRADWLDAMQGELAAITNADERREFIWGCFTVAVWEQARSRRGLHYMARACGSICLIAASAFGLYHSARLGDDPQSALFAQTVSALCFVYIGAALLLMISLRGLKIYAGLGFCLASAAFIYCYIVRPFSANLSAEFWTALSMEAAGLMASLFVASVYLGWFYRRV